MAKRPKRRASNPFSTINPHAAGIDIGATHHVVAVDPGRDPTPVRTFCTFSGELYALADWLHAVGITTVAMESTGVYWIPVFEILEARQAVSEPQPATSTLDVTGPGLLDTSRAPAAIVLCQRHSPVFAPRIRWRPAAPGVLLALSLCGVTPVSAIAQRQLHWSNLEATAHLKADGTLHVVETQTIALAGRAISVPAGV